MNDQNGRKIAFANISLSTIIQIATIGAMFVGNWYLMSERIENNAASTRDLRAQIATLDSKADILERDLATLTVRFENLREVVVELRRQSGLRRP